MARGNNPERQTTCPRKLSGALIDLLAITGQCRCHGQLYRRTLVVGTRNACADSLPESAGRIRSIPTANPVSTGIMDCDAARVLRRSVWW